MPAAPLTEIRRLKPELWKRFGVKSIAIFDCFKTKGPEAACELNVWVELNEPLGWEFFVLKNFLERKLDRRIDICTERSIKPAIKEKVERTIRFA
jgi:predicted nucleotidyltransferase